MLVSQLSRKHWQGTIAGCITQRNGVAPNRKRLRLSDEKCVGPFKRTGQKRCCGHTRHCHVLRCHYQQRSKQTDCGSGNAGNAGAYDDSNKKIENWNEHHPDQNDACDHIRQHLFPRCSYHHKLGYDALNVGRKRDNRVAIT